MELKKGYKQTEVGVIPEDWEVVRLINLSGLITKGTTPRNFSNIGVTYIKIESLAGDKIDIQKCLFVNRHTHNNELKRSILDAEDILFAIAGATIGKCTIVPDDILPANTNQALAIIRLKEQVNKTFVFWSLKSATMQKYIIDNIAGGAQPNLNLEQIGNYQIPLPPTREEQTAIATVLSDADALISRLETLIDKKQAIKQGAMQQLLKPKEGWVVKTIRQLADFKKELFDDGDWVEAEHITNEGVRLIQTGNIGITKYVEKSDKKYIFEASFEKLKCKSLIKGDLLICRLAEPAGRACILPDIGEEKVITSVDVSIFRPREELVNRVFLSYIFSTDDWFKAVSELCGGTTHKRISRGALGKINIMMPSDVKEQTRIAQILSDIDAEITGLEQKLSKYKRLKQGMMQELLTGKTRLV